MIILGVIRSSMPGVTGIILGISGSDSEHVGATGIILGATEAEPWPPLPQPIKGELHARTPGSPVVPCGWGRGDANLC